MNKRQRKKAAKKGIGVKTYLIAPKTVEVGDTVEIVGQSYGGYPVGTIGLVIDRLPHRVELDDDDRYVSATKKENDPYSMIHHVKDLKIIRKGGK